MSICDSAATAEWKSTTTKKETSKSRAKNKHKRRAKIIALKRNQKRQHWMSTKNLNQLSIAFHNPSNMYN